MSNKWRIVALAAALAVACTLAAAGERPKLEPGETNWIAPQYAGDQRATISTFSIAQGETAANMCATLLPGFTVSAAGFTGNSSAGGTFSGGGLLPVGPIGVPSGVLVSSGNIASVIGGPAGAANTQDWTTTVWGTPGFPVLTNEVPQTAGFDAAVLNCTFTSDAASRVARFEYVFASEEYNEWVTSGYNDVCGIFVNGLGVPSNWNLARVPPFGPGPPVLPVCVNNVNGGNPYPSRPWRNFLHYQDNDCNDPGDPGFPCAPPNRETEMDGLTKDDLRNRVFRSLPVLLIADQPYTIDFAVEDLSDGSLDSNLFVRGSEVGACCIPDAFGDFCDDLTISDCAGLGGTWSAGQLCTGITCGTTGGCCGIVVPGEVVADPTCVQTYEAECNAAGGVYQGDGPTCDPIGACEVDGECVGQTSQTCCEASGGVYQGAASVCEALGACCFEDQCSPALTEAECTTAGGEFQGEFTDCAVACEAARVPVLTLTGTVVLVMILLVSGVYVLLRMRH